MNKKQLNELSGLGSSSLLVVGKNGLRRIFCPFRVVCREPILYHFPGEVLFVSHVKLNQDLMLAFKIGEEFFLYRFFEILDS